MKRIEMSPNNPTTELPLWVQDRDAVMANDSEVKWREGKRPDYSETNRVLEKESQFKHVEGSLEAIAQNLVRTFEMEASNKSDPHQWLSTASVQPTLPTFSAKVDSRVGRLYYRVLLASVQPTLPTLRVRPSGSPLALLGETPRP